ncbi:unnamed protein product [Rotaria magnacalcarata]
MSTTSTQQVRPVIECFCQIISLHGFTSITPEIFRLAKFNRNEATTPLWRLIFEIIHYDPTRNSQQESINKFDQTSKDVLVEMIKSNLFTCGYTYEYFLALDNKMEQGSQQLLICLGWLIYQSKLIENIMEKCLNSDSIIDYDDTSSLYQNNKIERTKSSPLEKDLAGQVKQAMRVNSKLRFTLRRLHGLVIENTNLQHQIHGFHNMSSFEAHLCQHPHLLSHYMIELENENRKLNLFLFWNEHQDVFWKWMESVLDQETTVEEDEEEINDKYEPLRQVDRQRLEAEKQKFNAAIDTLDGALVRLKQLWISNNNHASIEHDVSSVVSSIDSQVSSLFNQLLSTNPSLSKDSNADLSLFLHQPQRLVYSKKLDSNDNSNFIKPTDFEHETTRMNKLQTNIDQHVDKQRKILDTLSQKFENVMIV